MSILATVLVATITGSAVNNMVKADKMNEAALKKLGKAFNRQVEAQDKLRKQRDKTDQALEKLVNRKKGLINTSIKDFLALYERIGKVNFNESDGIAELSHGSQLAVSVGEMRSMTTIAGRALTGKQEAVTFLVSGISGVIKKEAELNLASARMIDSQSQVIASQAETGGVALDAIYQAAERVSKVLAQLNVFLRNFTETTSVIIEKNGWSRQNYSEYDKDCIRTLVNTAVALKNVIDAPLFENDGVISRKVREVIETGEQYIQEISNLVNN